MRSKDLLYLSIALLAVLILVSACSAGFIIGRFASGGSSQAASLPVLITPSSSRSANRPARLMN